MDKTIIFKKNWKEFKIEAKRCINEIKNKETRKKQIPNMFTASRLLAPFFIIPSALLGNIPLTITFIVLFALTDTADGYFARKYNATSEFGRKLDPIVDKIFAGTLMIPLMILNPIILINLIFEASIAHINIKSHLNGNNPKTTYLGKFKTIILNLTIAVGYGSYIFNIPTNFLSFLIYTTAIVQSATTLQYHWIDKKVEAKKLNIINHKKTEDNKDIFTMENINYKEYIKEEKSNKNDSFTYKQKIDYLIEQKQELLVSKSEDSIINKSIEKTDNIKILEYKKKTLI